MNSWTLNTITSLILLMSNQLQADNVIQSMPLLLYWA